VCVSRTASGTGSVTRNAWLGAALATRTAIRRRKESGSGHEAMNATEIDFQKRTGKATWRAATDGRARRGEDGKRDTYSPP